MIVETLPEVQALDLNDKMLLVQELLLEIHEQEKHETALRSLVRKRLAEHEANPEEGRSWEEVKAELLWRPSRVGWKH